MNYITTSLTANDAASLAAAPQLPATRLIVALIPAVIVIGILIRWSLPARSSMIAIVRMLLQLAVLGYVLEIVFRKDNDGMRQGVIVSTILTIMVIVSSWISLRVTPQNRLQLFGPVMLSILCAGTFTLLVIIQGVVRSDPWYQPRILIPLAGMIFSNCMNAVSLAVERYNSEVERRTELVTARNKALEASLIPITNSLFAVGLVSIPGMMTGQVLSGESTVNAARYQVMVMLMMFGSAGMSAAMCLTLLQRRQKKLENANV